MRTSWTEVRKSCGLLPPFNLRIAIPFLLNVCLLGLIFLTCVLLLSRHELNVGTARFYFFLYLGILLVISAGLSKRRKLSYAILVWCAVELSLALLPSLLPKDDIIAADDTAQAAAFIYHPMLQSVLRPGYSYKTHLDFPGREKEIAEAAGIDVAALQGQELRFVHNALGLRGNELTANDLTKDLIFVYGGSTTYDSGVTQGETWVERLQTDLENKYTIINFGVPRFSTTEHLIQTAFYQKIVAKKPVCAVYYEGWNDMVEAHIEHLDSAYADFHLLRNAKRRDPVFLARYSPLIHLANAWATRRFDSIPPPRRLLGQSPVAGRDERLEAVFAEHIKTIAAINEARGIRTIFIGQIYNRRWPPEVAEKVFLPLVADINFLAERLKSVMRDAAGAIGARYIDAGIANFEGRDFVDSARFAARGSKKFAALVSEQVGDYCK
jgi:hypothetical protein